MKKVGELTFSYDDIKSRGDGGHINTLIDQNDDCVVFSEPVYVEPQQEAIFKVTHTVTVELIDIRMRKVEPPPKAPTIHDGYAVSKRISNMLFGFWEEAEVPGPEEAN